MKELLCLWRWNKTKNNLEGWLLVVTRTPLQKVRRQKMIILIYHEWLLEQESLTQTTTWVCRKLTCAPLSSSSSTVISADVPFSLTVECLPCQKKYTHFSFPTALTCCSPFCLLPTAKQKAQAEESTLAIGWNCTCLNFICQLSTIPSRTNVHLEEHQVSKPVCSLCKVGIVSSGGCKPTGRGAWVGYRRRCRKNWYCLERNNWHDLSQSACEMVCPVMLPEECYSSFSTLHTVLWQQQRSWLLRDTAEKATGTEVFLGIKWYWTRKHTEQKNTKAVFCSQRKGNSGLGKLYLCVKTNSVCWSIMWVRSNLLGFGLEDWCLVVISVYSKWNSTTQPVIKYFTPSSAGWRGTIKSKTKTPKTNQKL